MAAVIAALVVLGAFLLVIEVFVPGLVVGLCGFAALLAAAVLTYANFGGAAGHTVTFLLLLGGGGFVVWWLKFLPRSRIGRRWTLHETVQAQAEPLTTELRDAVGTALTTLRPAGIAQLAGQRVDVVAEGEFIPRGEAVRVVRVEGTRVVVRRVAPDPTLPVEPRHALR